MELPKLLSGGELVARGITKLDASLPEVGLKDVIPNGSWLEQKQIQSAIEARKHLIAVERIEKQGTPSHAIWRDDLMLAEVTKMAGGHWQYLGHNVGKTLFLRPEETLYLMEVNCLLLTHNEVTVSLQKAYSLLLHSPTTLIQYRVYASLSRLGYKVLTHKATDEKNKCIAEKRTINAIDDENMVIDPTGETKDSQLKANKASDLIAKENQTIDKNNVPKVVIEPEPIIGEDKTDKVKTVETNNDPDTETISSTDPECQTSKDCDITGTLDRMDTSPGISKAVNLKVQNNTEQNLNKTDVALASDVTQMDTDEGNQSAESLMKVEHIENSETCRNAHTNIKSSETLLRRQKSCNAKTLYKYFESIPELSKRQVVTINVPDQEFIPKNIFVNKNTYTLDLSNIKNKTSKSVSTESAYNSTDEVNGTHVRRISSSSATESQISPLAPNLRPPTQQFYFRPYSFWRPQNNINFYQFSMFLQRPSFPNMFMQSRFQFQSRSSPYIRPFTRPFFRPFAYPNTFNHNIPTPENLQKKPNRSRSLHLKDIKQLAGRLKQLIESGSQQIENITSLKSLLYSYNLRYKTKLRLTENCDIVNDEKIVETIELDDEEEPKCKKARVEEDVTYERNLNELKQLAETLKDLESKDKSTARHRRAFSNAIRTFNKSYNAEFYLNGNMELIDKRFINLDSSSESDCVVEETKTVRKRKKLRNPFNILKRLSQKLELETNQSAADNKKLEHCDMSLPEYSKYDKNITKNFNKNWLPDETDFGRAEVVSKDFLKSRLIDSNKELFIYDFIRDQFSEYNSWLEAKTSFLKHIEETDIAIQKEQVKLLAQSKMAAANDSELKPLIQFEDCANMQTVLETIRIIKNNKDVTATDLAVDFDVYNRDVQNFRKTNPPKPHFRIICLDESSNFPSTSEVSSLQSNYKDDVPIVFAIVSIASVSYIQLNPIELPVYVPANDAA